MQRREWRGRSGGWPLLWEVGDGGLRAPPHRRFHVLTCVQRRQGRTPAARTPKPWGEHSLSLVQARDQGWAAAIERASFALGSAHTHARSVVQEVP